MKPKEPKVRQSESILEALDIVKRVLNDKLSLDIATEVIHVIKKLPWQEELYSPDGEPYPDDYIGYHRKWLDRSDWTYLKALIESKYGVRFRDKDIEDAVMLVASQNEANPLKEHLLSLVWDYKPRLDSWLKDYLFVESSSPELVSMIGRKFLIGVVRRALFPGSKFDHMLIIQGDQGIGKSSVCRILAGSEEFYCEDLTEISNSKVVVEKCAGKMIVEIGELSAFSRQDQRQLKQFISRSKDSCRLSYRRNGEDIPRTFSFIGTTNEIEYLHDDTGNRRYWPVICPKPIDLEGLEKARNFILAEAMFYVMQYDEKPVLDRKFNAELEKIQQSKIETSYDLLHFLKSEWSNLLMGRDSSGEIKGSFLIEYVKNNFDSRVSHSTYSRALAKLGGKRKHTKNGSVWILPNEYNEIELE
jgi:predicted P-loop ATPase